MGNKTFEQERMRLVNEFTKCKPLLTAIGDETRQLILKTLMEHCGEGGLRVGEIQKNTNISRTAVSYHLKVLKDVEIITVRKQGTMNFYSFHARGSRVKQLAKFWNEAEQILSLCPINYKEVQKDEFTSYLL